MKRYLLIICALFALGLYSAPVALAKAKAQNETVSSACTSCHAELLQVRVAPVMPFVSASVEHIVVGSTGNGSLWVTCCKTAYKKPKKDYKFVHG